MKKALSWTTTLAAALLLVACGDNNTGSDSGTGKTLVTDPLQCNLGGGMVGDCDFSCLYTAYDPPLATGVDYTVSGIVNDFFDDIPVEGATVEVFLNGNTSGTPDGVSAITGMDGAFTISLTGVDGNVRAAYRTINNDPQYVDTFEYNEFLSEMGQSGQERFTVPTLTVQIILGLFNLVPDPSTGQIAGSFEDCSNQTVSNAVVRVFALPHACGAPGEPIAGRDGDMFRVGYFDGNDYPDPDRTLMEGLNTDGLWLGANISLDEVVVEVWGSMTMGADAQLLGCGTLNVFPGSISILDMGPYDETL